MNFFFKWKNLLTSRIEWNSRKCGRFQLAPNDPGHLSAIKIIGTRRRPARRSESSPVCGLVTTFFGNAFNESSWRFFFFSRLLLALPAFNSLINYARITSESFDRKNRVKWEMTVSPTGGTLSGKCWKASRTRWPHCRNLMKQFRVS